MLGAIVSAPAGLTAPAVLVLRDASDEDCVAVERHTRLASVFELHFSVAQAATDT